jgi:pyruvate dehydrogenase E2 component (dihydrolipoamide acetyltransferase)
MTSATITTTSLGDLGVEEVFGVIYPPQVAIVGFGCVLRKPIARGDQILVADTVVCTLSADHRASDGRQGALFLDRIKELLEEAEEL